MQSIAHRKITSKKGKTTSNRSEWAVCMTYPGERPTHLLTSTVCDDNHVHKQPGTHNYVQDRWFYSNLKYIIISQVVVAPLELSQGSLNPSPLNSICLLTTSPTELLSTFSSRKLWTPYWPERLWEQLLLCQVRFFQNFRRVWEIQTSSRRLPWWKCW